MFERILIANRGEIACRVIDTCRRLGVETVAVFSEADAGARHVAMADIAVGIGGAAPSESYLNGDRIIAAAKATGAEAIHPGYGFLSENPDFVQAVAAAGLVFIGPSAEAIRKMGLKDAAKAVMEAAGVPVVPGYHGRNQDDAHLGREADRIGFPVMIKAVAGGGGKGMRMVERAEDFAEALGSARSEARNAFGNDTVLIEKFVTRPRHIEIQVFGDGTRAVHLFERDCSLQRRHQKVIEEAPAPGMRPEMRAAMGAAAVRAAEAIGYAGAGTVEFIVDGTEMEGEPGRGFFFMEMNTRLQVEHPVTEEVTGVDLVEWQLRVAAGEDLPVRQDDLVLSGHAMEVRLYAEDAAAGFLPATGTLHALRFPDGVRIETGVREGDAISPHYDPMIAKIIARGESREAAMRVLARALGKMVVAGTVTNKAFLQALLGHQGFRAGRVDTGLIGREMESLVQTAEPPAEAVALAAIAALGLHRPGDDLQGFALWSGRGQPCLLRSGERELSLRVECDGGTVRRVMGEGMDLRLVRLGDAWRIDGRRMPDPVRVGARIAVAQGPGFVFEAVDPLDRASIAGPGEDVVTAPMPGLVRTLHVAPGDAVEAGDPLAVLEAMKMEHVLRAGRSGEIAKIMVEEGAQVSAGDALLRLAEE
ncbi:acetyl/propionyl/methylcrotonyl-CoA carboxylase subunit alpha [Palleronia sp. LCG004]|uniref:acetyl/propionyl/methylcrotonyl-CoA carboxylase subunit alpha n=1 Tax=Palleronia sp. LCG004 TaxID=3079304 RepID=UPI002943F1F9|nr:biotin carboxylase N-terminal domain-containing protein [Palleronia sp. LCG004]WOI54906.1 biotin carboxylase N-terminal domain-containing protein [Palleronia sp. LCG004]